MTDPSEMTNNELRLAIAEEINLSYNFVGEIPNYPGDLPAAFELEDILSENERKLYVKSLYERTDKARPLTVDSSPYPAQYWFVHATARQRCEAWLIARRG